MKAVVVDNSSSDASVSVVKNYAARNAAVTLISNKENVGFGRAVNQAFEQVSDRYALALNPDAKLHPDCLRTLAAAALNSEPQGFSQWEARQFPYEHPKDYDLITHETEWVSGACFLVRTSDFRSINGFDPAFFLYCEDVDLSWRLRLAGKRLMYVPKAVVYHKEAVSPLAMGFKSDIFLSVSPWLLTHKYGNAQELLIAYLRLLKLVFLSVRRGTIWFLISRLVKTLPALRKTLVWRCHKRREARKAGIGLHGKHLEVRRVGADFRRRPVREPARVSLLIRTRGRPAFLREVLCAVESQTYRPIEVVVVEDGTDTAAPVLREFPSLPIVYHRFTESAGRTRAGNKALALSTGRYCNFVDDDDLIYADHVETLVSELQANPRYLLAYSAAFTVKTDILSQSPLVYREYPYETIYAMPFSQKRLLHQNIVPILSAMFHRKLFEIEGGFDEALDQLEDWDLWLRYARHTDFLYVNKTTCIYRIPADPKALAERAVALDSFLPVVQAKHRLADREKSPRVEAEPEAADQRLSIVIVSYNSRRDLPQLLDSIARASAAAAVPCEVVVVDNASADGTADWLSRNRPGVRLIESTANCGYGKAANLGIRAASNPDVLLLNADTQLSPEFFADLRAPLRAIRAGRTALIGPMLRNPDGSIQYSAGLFPNLPRIVCGQFWPRSVRKYIRAGTTAPSAVDWVTGAAMLLSRDAILRLGGFNENFFMYYEDVDLCRRLWNAGYGVVYDPRFAVTHLRPHQARKSDSQLGLFIRRSQLYYFSLHGRPLDRAGLRALVLALAAFRFSKAMLLRLCASGRAEKESALSAQLLEAAMDGSRKTNGRLSGKDTAQGQVAAPFE